MKNVVLLVAQLKSPQGLADGSWKFTVYTRELDPHKATQILSLNNKEACLAIKAVDFTANELDIVDKVDVEGSSKKTPSQRLRSLLYVLYSKDNHGFKTFNEFYRHRMDLLCRKVKDELDRKVF